MKYTWLYKYDLRIVETQINVNILLVALYPLLHHVCLGDEIRDRLYTFSAYE